MSDSECSSSIPVARTARNERQEEVGQGTLFLNWSESVVDGAIAFFKPGKKVAPPAHPTRLNAA